MAIGIQIALVIALTVLAINVVAGRITLCGTCGLGKPRIKFHDREFLPMEFEELPGAAQRHFAALTPQMLAAGFCQIGDYLLSRKPFLSHIRYFISPDGRTFGTISYWKIGLIHRKATFGFVSVLADGTYVESSPEKAPEVRGPSARLLHFEGLPGASVDELYRFHQERTGALAAEYGTEPRVFHSEQFRDVGNYGHRLGYWSLHMRGYPVEPPPQEDMAPISAGSDR